MPDVPSLSERRLDHVTHTGAPRQESASVLEPLRRFPDDDACRRHVQKVRWGEGGYACERCGETERWGWLDSRNLFQCHHCGHQCSITSGTVMQNTKLPLHAWFVAAYVMHTSRGACRATDLARLLGIWPEAARSLMRKLGPALKTEEGRHLLGVDLPTLSSDRD